jgi:hypothetical protein
LVIDFANSASACGPNSRLMPPIGEILRKSGRIAAGVKPGLFWITLATTPAAAAAISTGASSVKISAVQWVISPEIVVLVTSGADTRAIVSASSRPIPAAIAGPEMASAPVAASSTAVEFTSCERATCPFFRASLRRLGVAFSVRSPAMGPLVVEVVLTSEPRPHSVAGV